MRYAYALLLLLLLAVGARGQHYCPLRPGLLYQFTQLQSDTTYGVLLNKKGTLNGMDSTYAIAPRLKSNGPTSCATRFTESGWGSSLRIHLPGTFRAEYTLRDATQRKSIVLKPYAALSQPWQATLGAGISPLTAQVTARNLGVVLGVADSVVTITFSNGQMLQLSKQFGLVEGPALADLLLAMPTVRTFRLTALPTQHLGVPRLGVLAMYDFQPGDVFYYRSAIQSFIRNIPLTISQYADSVMSRATSRTGDTVRYQVWHYEPSAPTHSRIDNRMFTAQLVPLLQAATGQFVPTSSNRQSGISVGDVVTNNWGWPNGRLSQRLRDRYNWCSSTPADSVHIRGPLTDYERDYTYGLGLGQTYFDENNGGPFETEGFNLIGYHKGSERWGVSFRIAAPLGIAVPRPSLLTTACPNPFARSLTANLTLARPQPITAELHDALGLVVSARPASAFAAGPQQLTLPTSDLPPGIYTLHLLFIADGHREVLRVVKAE